MKCLTFMILWTNQSEKTMKMQNYPNLSLLKMKLSFFQYSIEELKAILQCNLELDSKYLAYHTCNNKKKTLGFFLEYFCLDNEKSLCKDIEKEKRVVERIILTKFLNDSES